MHDMADKASGVGAAAGGVAGGIAGGAAAGAAVGGVTGPVGAAVGAVAGAAVGALAGRGVAKADPTVDPSTEETYWRDNFATRPYAPGASYDDYGPAYRFGVDAYAKYPGKTFADVDAELGGGWVQARGGSTLDWEQARPASLDAWQRLHDSVERVPPADAGKAGR